MQTFLPYPDFVQSVICLDDKRLGKQRVEAFQLHTILNGNAKSKAWSHHPACLMWKGYENALAHYYNCCLIAWQMRGYKNIKLQIIDLSTIVPMPMPDWFGSESFHASHRSNLLRKKPEFYSKYGWKEPSDLPYVWPTKT